MLIDLELSNFQTHRSLSHRFTPGLNLIVGPNWSGKSTVLRAVKYALFGASGVEIKAEQLTSRGTSALSVTLRFSFGNETYRVERGPRKAVLYRGETLAASGQTAVTAEIESMIGPAKSFLAYRTARANEVGSLLSLGAAKLSQHIESVLGVEIVDAVLERIRQRRSSMEAVSAALLVELSEQELFLSTELSQLGTQIDEQSKELALHTALANDWLASQLQWEAYVAALQAQQAQFETFAGKRTQLGEQIGRAQMRLSELGALQDEPTEDLAELRAQIETMRADLQQQAAARKVREQLGASLKAAQSVLGGLAVPDPFAMTEAQSAQAELQAAYDQAMQGRHVAASDLTRLRDQENGASCALCKRPFAEHDVEQLAAETEQARLRFVGLEQAAAEVSRSLTAAKAAVDQLLSRSSAHASAQANVASLQAQFDAAPEPATHVTQQALAELDRYYQDCLSLRAAWDAQRAGREQAMREIATCEAQLAELPQIEPVDRNTLDSAQQTLNEARALLPKARARQGEVEGVLAQLRARKTATVQSLSSVREKLDTVKAQHARVALLDRLSKYLRAHRDSFTAQAWGSLLDYASTFVQAASGGDLVRLERTEKGEFCFVEGGETFPVEVASGMQEAILGVGLKLALAAAVGSSFDVMLFDEIAAAGSDENALRLTEQLARAGHQILLVSHREADTAAAASVLAL